MKIGIYPGSFDPFTNGHNDILSRSLKIFDKVIIAVVKNSAKNYLFSLEDRIQMVNQLFKNQENISCIGLDSKLTVNLASELNAQAIIRGLRAVSDFEYEFQLAGMNKKLNSKIETMFLMSDVENQIISSKFVKEIASLGGNINKFVTKSTVKVLKDKF